jgi:hypothetical protein
VFRIEENVGYGWEDISYLPDFDTAQEAEDYIGDGSSFDGQIRVIEEVA